MAIRTVVTRGFGNGTFNGTIGLVTLRGYKSGVVAVPDVEGLEYTLKDALLHYTLPDNVLDYELPENRLNFTLRDEND